MGSHRWSHSQTEAVRPRIGPVPSDECGRNRPRWPRRLTDAKSQWPQNEPEKDNHRDAAPQSMRREVSPPAPRSNRELRLTGSRPSTVSSGPRRSILQSGLHRATSVPGPGKERSGIHSCCHQTWPAKALGSKPDSRVRGRGPHVSAPVGTRTADDRPSRQAAGEAVDDVTTHLTWSSEIFGNARVLEGGSWLTACSG